MLPISRNPPVAALGSTATLPPPIDIVDECIRLYRPNVFFRTFTVNSNSDRTLIYGILFVGDCLNRLSAGMLEAEAQKALAANANEKFAIPGEPGFPLNSIFPSASSSREAGSYVSFFYRTNQRVYAAIPTGACFSSSQGGYSRRQSEQVVACLSSSQIHEQVPLIASSLLCYNKVLLFQTARQIGLRRQRGRRPVHPVVSDGGLWRQFRDNVFRPLST